MDQDNILYEGGPKFVEEQLSRELTEVDIALLQTHTYFLMKNLPKDEHREEVLRPFVQVITKPENKKNWLLDTNGLFLRTKNDFERSKTKEQAMVFFGGLLDSFRSQDSTFGDKVCHVFSIGYPLRWIAMK